MEDSLLAASDYLCGILGPDARDRVYESASGDEGRAQFRCLLDHARERGCLLSQSLRSGKSVTQGNEHVIEFDEDSGLVYKTTKPDLAGFVAVPVWGLHKETQKPVTQVRLSCATPIGYLDRWRLFNEVFGDQVGLAAIVETPAGTSLQISQLTIGGTTPSRGQVMEFMRGEGFESLDDEFRNWWRAEDRLIAADAKTENFKLTPDGNVVPIDLVPLRVGDMDSWHLEGTMRF